MNLFGFVLFQHLNCALLPFINSLLDSKDLEIEDNIHLDAAVYIALLLLREAPPHLQMILTSSTMIETHHFLRLSWKDRRSALGLEEAPDPQDTIIALTLITVIIIEHIKEHLIEHEGNHGIIQLTIRWESIQQPHCHLS